jgi:murein DD-endopeptidase MepM/ murein hydrolase activator NlpD
VTPAAALAGVMLVAASAAAPTPPSPRTGAPSPAAEPTPIVSAEDLAELRARALLSPVPAIRWEDVRDTFDDRRGAAPHEALDIAAPRGTPAVVAKLFRSVPGGLTVYLFDRDRRFAYYYAHLDGYAPGLHETQAVKRGDVVGYVGSTGNAAVDAPHLHFAIFKLEPAPRWWRGTALDPHPLLRPSDGSP